MNHFKLKSVPILKDEFNIKNMSTLHNKNISKQTMKSTPILIKLINTLERVNVLLY